MRKTRGNLDEKVKEILKEAERLGLSDNYLFQTTFERYQRQMQILKDLDKEIKKYGTTITKINVKGNECVAVNPALTEYNKTSSAANGTVATLMNIVKSAKPVEDKTDSLAEFLDD